MFLPEIVLLIGGILLFLILLRRLRIEVVPTAEAERRRVLRATLTDGGLVVAIVGAVLLWALWLPAARAPLLEADSKDLPLTTVAPVPEFPLLGTRNLLWCASFPLAWDALRRDVLGGSPVLLDPPACREAMAALNANPFPAADLDPACVVAMAGTAKSGIERKVRDALRGRAEVALPVLGPEDALALGFLEKDLPFAIPFETVAGGIPFGPEGRRVRAFGLAHHSTNPRKEEILEQVRIHLAEADGEDTAFARLRPDRFVVELLPRGGKDRILLAQVKPEATLQATWEKVRAAAAGPGREASSSTVLAVPKLNFDIDHRFSEFAGAKGPFGVLREARQRTRFRLDETGARLRSMGSLHLTLGIDPTFEFRGPFLIALVQKGAARPYLLLWVGNDELLSPE